MKKMLITGGAGFIGVNCAVHVDISFEPAQVGDQEYLDWQKKYL